MTLATAAGGSSIAPALERAVDACMAPALEQKKVSGVVLVAQNGKPLLRKAYGYADWPKEWAAVTIHDLLTHSSGIDVDTQAFWLFRVHPEYWPDAAQDPPAYTPKALLNEPGTTFRYSNAGYTVLSTIVAQVGGKAFQEVMAEHVFGPLAMHDTAFEGVAVLTNNPNGAVTAPMLAEIAERAVCGK